ncbi:MAG TPA: MGMT family protein [Dermatophilaceae bacterium]|nr:MGMT family protein [Dermatophilaceae bacterium]
MAEDVVERVLDIVEYIPAGRVVSYGDVAGLAGCGPRQVGSIMARYGGGVPWWRVTNASGDLPAHLRATARSLWLAEGIQWKPNGLGCRIADYRADLSDLADAVESLWAAERNREIPTTSSP